MNISGLVTLFVLLAFMAADSLEVKKIQVQNEKLAKENQARAREMVELQERVKTVAREKSKVSPSAELLELRNLAGSLRNVEAELAAWEKQRLNLSKKNLPSSSPPRDTATTEREGQALFKEVQNWKIQISNPETLLDTLRSTTENRTSESTFFLLQSILKANEIELKFVAYNEKSGALMLQCNFFDLVRVANLLRQHGVDVHGTMNDNL